MKTKPSALVLPAGCCSLTGEELCYIQGGADSSEIMLAGSICMLGGLLLVCGGQYLMNRAGKRIESLQQTLAEEADRYAAAHKGVDRETAESEARSFLHGDEAYMNSRQSAMWMVRAGIAEMTTGTVLAVSGGALCIFLMLQ